MRLFGQQQQVNRIFSFLTRHLRLISICLLVGLAAGLGFYVKSPKSYQSTALIIYQQQQINPTKMSPDVQTQLKRMVSTVSQQVTSRTSLEELIKTHGLYPELRKKLPMEDVVAVMRDKHITIKPGRGDVFQVSFSGAEPGKVMRVTNDLASKFVEENIRFREERVTETSAYVKEELEMAKAALDKKEVAMRDYKLKYYNEMPQQRQSNISRLNALQDQYQQVQSSIQELERTKVMVQEQISLWRAALSQSSPAVNVTGAKPVSEVVRLRQELEDLRSRYTDNHPDVKRLRNRLATLLAEQEQSSITGAGSSEDNGGQSPAASGTPTEGIAPNSQLAQLQLQLKEIELRIDRLTEEQQAIRKQVELVQEWVEAAPVREAEWAALTRDYQQLQQHYETLVARNLEAESAESLEKRQKGSQFKIIEPAYYPEKPFSPDFLKIMVLTAGLGLGAGVGLAYGLEFLNSSFKDINDMESFLGMKANCAIPVLLTSSEKKSQKVRNVFWTTALVTGFLLLSGSMVWLWQKGLIVI